MPHNGPKLGLIRVNLTVQLKTISGALTAIVFVPQNFALTLTINANAMATAVIEAQLICWHSATSSFPTSVAFASGITVSLGTIVFTITMPTAIHWALRLNCTIVRAPTLIAYTVSNAGVAPSSVLFDVAIALAQLNIAGKTRPAQNTLAFHGALLHITFAMTVAS